MGAMGFSFENLHSLCSYHFPLFSAMKFTQIRDLPT